MKRLRHPIRSLSEPFGKAGLTVAVLALVMALVGGAYAAGGLTKSQEKQVKKIAKKYAGKPGAPGVAGTNGSNGSNGKDGAPGAPGAPGESVNVSSYEGEECEEAQGEEGVELTNGTGTAYACNGKEGSPWTAGGTLPKGATETGTYAPPTPFHLGAILVPIGMAPDTEFQQPISFGIPLASAPEFVYVPSTATGYGTAAGCPGVVGGLPKADSGKFCVYEVKDPFEGAGAKPNEIFAFDPATGSPGTANAGAGLAVRCDASTENLCIGAGLWAVAG